MNCHVIVAPPTGEMPSDCQSWAHACAHNIYGSTESKISNFDGALHSLGGLFKVWNG